MERRWSCRQFPDALKCPQMTGHGAKFGRKKEEAIAALLSQRNVEEAARAVGVDAKTLLRWMKEPEFDAEYRNARRAAFGQSVARLQQASGAAVSTLLKLMIDSNTPASTRARCADSVLSHTAKAIELDDIESRLSELERASEERSRADEGKIHFGEKNRGAGKPVDPCGITHKAMGDLHRRVAVRYDRRNVDALWRSCVDPAPSVFPKEAGLNEWQRPERNPISSAGCRSSKRS
jgi:transposase-like protein